MGDPSENSTDIPFIKCIVNGTTFDNSTGNCTTKEPIPSPFPPFSPQLYFWGSELLVVCIASISLHGLFIVVSHFSS